MDSVAMRTDAGRNFLFVGGLAIIAAGFVAFFLHTKDTPAPAFSEAACTWDAQKENCLVNNVIWNTGLKYFEGQVSGKSSYTDTLAALKNLLWSDSGWSLKFAGAGMAAVRKESVLPLRVLAKDSSGCLGLAWLAMMIAEREKFPLEAVLLPSHITLRYHGIYIEPNRQGYAYSEEEYRRKYATGHWTGFEWTPLTRAQFLGLAAFNLGNAEKDRNPKIAVNWYELAEKLFPGYPGIRINKNFAEKKIKEIR